MKNTFGQLNNIDRLLQAFPKTLHSDVLTVLNVLPLDQHNVRLTDGQIHVVDNLIFPENYNVVLNGETLSIPYRIYFNEPDTQAVNKLTSRQRTILHALYLRHHDGHVRQRHLESLNGNNDVFVIPFALQLLGEYVIEILFVLNDCITPDNIKHYHSFIIDNSLFWRITQKRMVSYWNEYYRRPFYPKLRDYIGTNIVNRLKKTTA